VLEGDDVVLDGTLTTDADGDPLLFTWSQTAGAPRPSLSGAFSIRARFVAPEVSEASVLTFRLTVSDGLAAGAAQTSVTILPR
jgi:hypothetical protein